MNTANKNGSIKDFSNEDKELYPLTPTTKKYPKHLAVLQNSFFNIKHVRPPKDDLIKLLMFFSPKVRLASDVPNETTIFSISAKEYADLTGLDIKGAYTALSRVVDVLYDHSVIFYNEDRGDVRTRLVSSSAYKDGRFTVSFTHFALHILSVFNKENSFTKLQIKSIGGLSGHSLKIYPLLIQNEFRQFFEISIIDLKELLHIDIESYSDYKEFKKHVLKPHVDMINLKTELSIHFEALKKEGRKASHVGFTISRKKQAQEITKQPEQPEQPEQPIKALDIYKAISNNNLIDRFLQHGESTEDLINRIKSDFKNDQSDLWINKLLEFDITF